MPPASPSVHPNECILRSITARSLAIDPLAIRSLLRPALRYSDSLVEWLFPEAVAIVRFGKGPIGWNRLRTPTVQMV
jgi:hypothetical protein